MIVEKGGVNAEVFIEFLKRLIAGANRSYSWGAPSLLAGVA